MADNDVLNALLTGGMPQQAQSQIGNVLQGLLQYAQNTPNPQSANAALGPSTTNLMNNAATATGNPNVAAGNYDATQNTGINQQQLSQVLQTLAQTNKQGVTNVNNQPGTAQPMAPAQQMQYDSAKKNLSKYYDNHAQNTPPGVLEQYVNQIGASQPGQVGQPQQVGQNLGGQQPAPLNQSSLQAPQSQQTKPSAPVQNNNQQSTSPINNPGDPIQEKALQIATQKPGLLMSIFRGTFENDNAAKLANLKEAQSITQGGTPLSPQQKTEAIGNWNSALLKQHQDFQEDLSTQMKSNVDAMESFVKNTPLPTKATGWSDYNTKLQQYHTNIRDIAEKQLQGYNQFTQLQLTNPLTENKESVSSQGNQYANITPDMARQEIANRIRNRQRGNQ